MRGTSYCGHCMINSGHPLQPACMGVKAAFFGDFLCSSKESYPPAGEAATEQEGKTPAAPSTTKNRPQRTLTRMLHNQLHPSHPIPRITNEPKSHMSPHRQRIHMIEPDRIEPLPTA